MSVLQVVTCPGCGAAVPGVDNFCPGCGAHVPRVIVPVSEGGPPTGPPRRKRGVGLALAAVVVLGLVLVGAALYGLLRQTPAEKQYDASAPVLTATLDDLSTAQSTRMVRDISADAVAEQGVIQDVMDADMGARGVDRLVVMRDAFGELAALQGYKASNTAVWTQNRSGLIDDLAVLSSYGGTTAQVGEAGEDAVRTVDDLTARINRAMAEYREQLQAAKDSAVAKRTNLRDYRRSMNALLAQFSEVQSDIAGVAQRATVRRTHLYDVIDAFDAAGIAQRDLLVRMAQVPSAPGTRAQHLALLAVLGDEVDLLDSATVELGNALCRGEGCYLIVDPAWMQLRTDLDQRVAAVDGAMQNWREAVSTAKDQAQDVQLPKKPYL